MSKQVVIYPSGFIGYDVGWPLVKEQDSAEGTLQLFGATKSKVSISNRAIEILFHEWNTKTRKFSDARFLSDVLSACCNAFGTQSFYEWLHIQEQNPYFTSYHRQFLNETLDVIFKGQRRPTLLPTWATVLKPSEATPQDKNILVNDEMYLNQVGKEDMLVLNVVQQWTQSPGGWADLLYSMHLIFGDP